MQTISKYLNPGNYMRYFKNRLINLNFLINRSFVSSTIVNGKEIFSIHSIVDFSAI